MNAIQRYELIRPIVHQEKAVKEVHAETGVPISTLYRYRSRFRQGDGQLKSLADKSLGSHNHPNWFTEEDKDRVVCYKLHSPHLSNRQIAKELTDEGILKISPRSVDNILKQRRLTDIFFWTNRES